MIHECPGPSVVCERPFSCRASLPSPSSTRKAETIHSTHTQLSLSDLVHLAFTSFSHTKQRRNSLSPDYKMKDFRACESVTVSPGQYVYKVIPSNPGLSCITSANELVCLDATTLKVVLRLSGETLPTSLSCLQASLDDSMLHCAGGDGVVASFDPRAGGRVNAFKAGT